MALEEPKTEHQLLGLLRRGQKAGSVLGAALLLTGTMEEEAGRTDELNGGVTELEGGAAEEETPVQHFSVSDC